jgi:hypothetical protein
MKDTHMRLSDTAAPPAKIREKEKAKQKGVSHAIQTLRVQTVTAWHIPM